MTDTPNPKMQSGELPRFENILLCAPAGDEKVTVTPTIKWMEIVMVTKPGEDGAETTQVLGFLVTVPPRNAQRVYSHICHEARSHAQAISFFEKDKPQKDRTPGSLPTVWNGHYTGCPLCGLLNPHKENENV